MTTQQIMTGLGVLVIAPPAALLAVLGLASLCMRPLNEQWISRLTQFSILTGLAAAIGLLGMMLALDTRHVPIEFGNLVAIPGHTEDAASPGHTEDAATPSRTKDVATPGRTKDTAPGHAPQTKLGSDAAVSPQHFHFHLKFVFDRLSVPFVILSYVLGGTVAAFTTRYLHREKGYNRFSVCYAFFMLGMIVTSLAGTIEVLFLGWELVGLSSALLVAYFHERPAPVVNGLRVWTVYRLADAALLIAAIAMHHLTGEGDFDVLMGAGPWPFGEASVSGVDALFIGVLLLIAAAGKSALVPFSGWLPRAMEGPTPSSAIFYGALSVHLGAFLLLRASPILKQSMLLSALVVTLGIVTAFYAAITARVQTDIKSLLAFASLTQVGIIVAEIGCGLHYIPLIHMIGHACLRTLQLLRAPTLLRDYQTLENATGGRLHSARPSWPGWLPVPSQIWWYRLASERGYFDGWLNEGIVAPFRRTFEWCDRMERGWTNLLAGRSSAESDPLEAGPPVVEEMKG